ncbi:hypothetical protein MGYG_05924 [Nannizzia gypsea CBS 118893]|uniref:Uncharacterized protein n=1 Tax=Arthroderma gypseum (strain ATCC MYA-4604 / CBS 118893) TaxID=535722 RepID=E4UZY6_ARTGP|nr:hypothetical protein MGYG_05924 [Nannizzia gypsea CBS 118893]EFR02923.1 hypothetical protein MGYG_05924 [Nannizzia gypsea CBS 118893]
MNQPATPSYLTAAYYRILEAGTSGMLLIARCQTYSGILALMMPYFTLGIYLPLRTSTGNGFETVKTNPSYRQERRNSPSFHLDNLPELWRAIQKPSRDVPPSEGHWIEMPITKLYRLPHLYRLTHLIGEIPRKYASAVISCLNNADICGDLDHTILAKGKGASYLHTYIGSS